MNPSDYFLQGSLTDHMYHTNLHIVQEVQVETEAVTEDITGDTLCDTVTNFEVH
jgi:hypothetical protein